MKEQFAFVIEPQDVMTVEMTDIQGGKKTVGTIKCKEGTVTIKTGEAEK